jgi:SM-20-related protein
VLYQTAPALLRTEETAEILGYAMDNQHRFSAATVGGDSIDAAVRRSRLLRDLGEHRALVESRVLAWVPSLIRELRLTSFEPTSIETELVAHEDGAFYQRHLDLFTGDVHGEYPPQDRLISIVCYLNREPKPYQGGELRVFTGLDVANPPLDQYIDIEPRNGMAVAFSSWLIHEVRPVRCPSERFEDARFAINCWVLRERAPRSHGTAPIPARH